ncbi:MAG: YjgP/YjgQ family permease [Verrucomicrobiaceae bacterium]|nr:YjgP/YjgQ family permease [Verrucomicrobiaceae bacterium]
MGKLDKYIFWQVAGAAFMTVALFVFVLVLGNIFRVVLYELLSGRVTLTFFFEMVALIIPSVIPYSLPMGMLTGILLVFGRMSAQSEIIAMKACGRSIYAMIAPVFLLAMLASVFSLFINFYYAPAASYAYKNAIKNVIRNNPLQFIQSGKFVKDFPGYVIYANKSNSETHELVGFRIWELDKQGRASVSIKSDKAIVSYSDVSDEIVLVLKNGSAERSNSQDPELLRKPLPSAKFESLTVKLPLNKIIGESYNEIKKPKRMTFDELLEARNTWHRIPLEKLEKLPPEERKERLARDKIEVNLQIQKNFAMAFSIFSLVVLAVPLGIKASRSETFVNLAIAIALAMTYYMMTVFIAWLEKYPEIRPDLLIWIPNFLFQGIGGYLIIRSSKH